MQNNQRFTYKVVKFNQMSLKNNNGDELYYVEINILDGEVVIDTLVGDGFLKSNAEKIIKSMAELYIHNLENGISTSGESEVCQSHLNDFAKHREKVQQQIERGTRITDHRIKL